MSHGSRWNVGLRHAAVAVAYALGYLLLRQVSWSHWIIFAGYRYSVLLLVPYRYWPALLVGEMGPVAYASLSCIETFGWVWSSLMLVPPLAMAMPIVRFGRDRLGMIPARGRGQVRFAAVLACTLMVSAVWTLAYVVTLSTVHVPADFPPIDYGVEGARWFIGNYLGILTVVPLVLLVWQGRTKRLAWPASFKRAMRRPLTVEMAAFVLPALALLIWLGVGASSEGARSVARMAMFLPVVWLALRHGWHGAAIGGTAASVAVALTMPRLYDSSTLQAEVFVAFATSSMLLFGSRIAALHQQKGASLEHGHDRQSLELARRIQAQYEAQLCQSALGVERVSEAMRTTEELLLDRLRRYSPLVDTRELLRRTTAARWQLFQLIDDLYPASLQKHGLLEALRHGGIARALSAHGIGYWCHARGAIPQLSPSVQLALHRLVCEGVSHLCGTHSVQDVTVHLRSGQRDNRHWVVVRIDALFVDDTDRRVHGALLVQRLAGTGLGIEAIRDQAALYEGTVHVRGTEHGKCISVLMREPKAHPPQRVAAVVHATRIAANYR